MKTSKLTLAFVLLTASMAFAAVSDGIGGKWNILAQSGGQSVEIAAEISADGDKFSGSTSSELGAGQIINGKINGDKFTATLRTEVLGSVYEFAMEGTLTKDGMTGTLSNSNFGTVSFTATRAKN